MRYPLKACEREVTIRFDMEERVAHIYTSEPVYMRRLDKLVETLPEVYKCVKVDELGYFKKYECPMKFIKFGKPITNRKPLSDEEKARRAEFLRQIRKSKGNLNANVADEDFIDDDMSGEET